MHLSSAPELRNSLITKSRVAQESQRRHAIIAWVGWVKLHRLESCMGSGLGRLAGYPKEG